MKKHITLLMIYTALLMLPTITLAQPDGIKPKTNLDSLCTKNTFTGSNGHVLPWRGYESPKSENDKKALFIFLHGSGERGEDNTKQLQFMDILFPVQDSLDAYPALYIFPQCAEEMRWVECDWDAAEHRIPAEPSKPMFALYELLKEKLATGNYDEKRVYIIGLSMGGFGVWDMLARTPEMIAAAVPICGGADDSLGAKMVGIPVHAFHGAKDKAVDVSRSRNIINAIKNAGGSPIYTEYPDEGHGSWIPAFKNRELLPWIFAQRR